MNVHVPSASSPVWRGERQEENKKWLAPQQKECQNVPDYTTQLQSTKAQQQNRFSLFPDSWILTIYCHSKYNGSKLQTGIIHESRVRQDFVSNWPFLFIMNLTHLPSILPSSFSLPLFSSFAFLFPNSFYPVIHFLLPSGDIHRTSAMTRTWSKGLGTFG